MTNKRIKGNKKWKAKNRVRVALLTAKPPHTHITRSLPTNGTADRKFVITVAAQYLICPHGRTYPINAIIIVRKNITSPDAHTWKRRYEP